jgi:hypothetical protein
MKTFSAALFLNQIAGLGQSANLGSGSSHASNHYHAVYSTTTLVTPIDVTYTCCVTEDCSTNTTATFSDVNNHVNFNVTELTPVTELAPGIISIEHDSPSSCVNLITTIEQGDTLVEEESYMDEEPACAQDARQCWDGSYVSRNSSNACAFASCPDITCGDVSDFYRRQACCVSSDVSSDNNFNDTVRDQLGCDSLDVAATCQTLKEAYNEKSCCDASASVNLADKFCPS